jgi:hypothetical protein
MTDCTRVGMQHTSEILSISNSEKCCYRPPWNVLLKSINQRLPSVCPLKLQKRERICVSHLRVIVQAGALQLAAELCPKPPSQPEQSHSLLSFYCDDGVCGEMCQMSTTL